MKKTSPWKFSSLTEREKQQLHDKYNNCQLNEEGWFITVSQGDAVELIYEVFECPYCGYFSYLEDCCEHVMINYYSGYEDLKFESCMKEAVRDIIEEIEDEEDEIFNQHDLMLDFVHVASEYVMHDSVEGALYHGGDHIIYCFHESEADFCKSLREEYEDAKMNASRLVEPD